MLCFDMSVKQRRRRDFLLQLSDLQCRGCPRAASAHGVLRRSFRKHPHQQRKGPVLGSLGISIRNLFHTQTWKEGLDREVDMTQLLLTLSLCFVMNGKRNSRNLSFKPRLSGQLAASEPLSSPSSPSCSLLPALMARLALSPGSSLPGPRSCFAVSCTLARRSSSAFHRAAASACATTTRCARSPSLQAASPASPPTCSSRFGGHSSRTPNTPTSSGVSTTRMSVLTAVHNAQNLYAQNRVLPRFHTPLAVSSSHSPSILSCKTRCSHPSKTSCSHPVSRIRRPPCAPSEPAPAACRAPPPPPPLRGAPLTLSESPGGGVGCGDGGGGGAGLAAAHVHRLGPGPHVDAPAGGLDQQQRLQQPHPLGRRLQAPVIIQRIIRRLYSGAASCGPRGMPHLAQYPCP